MDQNTTSHKTHAKIEAPPFSATQIAYIRQIIREELQVIIKQLQHQVGMRPPEVK